MGIAKRSNAIESDKAIQQFNSTRRTFKQTLKIHEIRQKAHAKHFSWEYCLNVCQIAHSIRAPCTWCISKTTNWSLTSFSKSYTNQRRDASPTGERNILSFEFRNCGNMMATLAYKNWKCQNEKKVENGHYPLVLLLEPTDEWTWETVNR